MASSSCESGVTVTSVCQTCGDKGEAHLLIHCVKCQDSAVHHYCLYNFCPDDDKITWMCEECAPKIPKVMPSRTSVRVNIRKERALEIKMDWKKKLNKNIFSKANRSFCMKDKLAETAQLTRDYSLPREEMKSLPSIDRSNGNQRLIKQSQRLVLEDGDNPVEDSELVKAATSMLVPYGNCGSPNVSYGQPSIEFDNYIPAQPVIDQIWRGFFNILNKENERFELMAHLSNKACSRVSDAATLLPTELDVHILPKCEIWPKSFKRSPPTDDSIALYFFPMYERDEKVFDSLLDEIIGHDLSLKALINNVELLVFSSLELPQHHWRFCRKYYMWGVFRQKQHSFTLEQTNHPAVQSSSSQSVTPSKCTTQAMSERATPSCC